MQRLLPAENRVLTNGTNGPGEAVEVVDDDDAKILEPKEELQYLSEVLGFVVTFTDFPQKSGSKSKTSGSSQNSSPEFITLVKLSTKPPKVSSTSYKPLWPRDSQTICAFIAFDLVQ